MRPKPFLKWLGGKTRLLPELKRRMPQQIGTYVEPFAGGAALFFDTRPTQAILNDANHKLVNLYISVRDHKDELVASLSSYEYEYNSLTTLNAKQDFYYQSRTEFNACGFETDLTVSDAARFVFLNKTCFNGLYRENAAGKFNAAFGWKQTVRLYDDANLTSCSSTLQDVLIGCGDFEDVCMGLSDGDFVYFDPPYNSTFNSYRKGGFGEECQMRLHSLFDRLTERGVRCMLSNSNTEFVRNLYGGYNIEVVLAKRMINRNSAEHNGEELIITNYKSNY